MAASNTGKIIGELIRKYRKQRGMSQKDLADCMGVDFQVVSDYERGRRVPGIDLLIKFCECLNISLTTFMTSFDKRRPID